MPERIIGIIAILPLALAIYVLIHVVGFELTTAIISAMFLPLLIVIVIFFIILSTIYGVCKIITG